MAQCACHGMDPLCFDCGGSGVTPSGENTITINIQCTCGNWRDFHKSTTISGDWVITCQSCGTTQLA